jgi:hypothetical protein
MLVFTGLFCLLESFINSVALARNISDCNLYGIVGATTSKFLGNKKRYFIRALKKIQTRLEDLIDDDEVLRGPSLYFIWKRKNPLRKAVILRGFFAPIA